MTWTSAHSVVIRANCKRWKGRRREWVDIYLIICDFVKLGAKTWETTYHTCGCGQWIIGWDTVLSFGLLRNKCFITYKQILHLLLDQIKFHDITMKPIGNSFLLIMFLTPLSIKKCFLSRCIRVHSWRRKCGSPLKLWFQLDSGSVHWYYASTTVNIHVCIALGGDMVLFLLRKAKNDYSW